MIIAIDGPAGAGKSTVAKMLARKLGFLYIDTGAMYRALALKAIETNLDPADIHRIIKMSGDSNIELANNPDGSLKIFLDGRNVTREIRRPQVTTVVSDIAKIREVRQVLLGLQRKLGRQVNCVMDGRDIGTVVFPDAEKKFYIDAKFETRVLRRYEELKGLGQEVTFEAVWKDLHNRDTIDSTRAVAPLKKAEDAIYVDTTDMSIDEVVAALLRNIPNG